MTVTPTRRQRLRTALRESIEVARASAPGDEPLRQLASFVSQMSAAPTQWPVTVKTPV